jgi:hypothetical protein
MVMRSPLVTCALRATARCASPAAPRASRRR